MKNAGTYAKVAVASVLWGSAFLFGKIGLAYLPPLRLASFRLMVSCAMLFCLVRRNPFAQWTRTSAPWILLYSLLQTVLSFSLFNYGLSLVPGSFGSMVIGMSPAISAVVAAWMLPDEHLTLKLVGSMFVGVFAVVLLSVRRQALSLSGTEEIFGICMLLFCNVAGAFANVIARRRLSRIPSQDLNLLQMLIGTIVLTSMSLVFEPWDRGSSVPLSVVVSIGILAFITAAATSLWLGVVQGSSVPIARLAMMKMLIPTVGTLLGWLFIPGDDPSWNAVFALVLIVYSIVLSLSEKKKVLLVAHGKQEGTA